MLRIFIRFSFSAVNWNKLKYNECIIISVLKSSNATISTINKRPLSVPETLYDIGNFLTVLIEILFECVNAWISLKYF